MNERVTNTYVGLKSLVKYTHISVYVCMYAFVIYIQHNVNILTIREIKKSIKLMIVYTVIRNTSLSENFANIQVIGRDGGGLGSMGRVGDHW